ncbi:MAG: C4-dicarboxylate TRAP transporter substrate-binding protein [Treponema sp.]|jgi:tripartite ATP-independent transporter DctP family solute receptor|nr:C4-dicarboxylate TRAP transporter substrate-binding protein [Treponema sp.]
MKKIIIPALALILTAGTVFAGAGAQGGGAQAAAAKPLVVQIGYENNPGELVDLAIHEWKRLLEQKSGGAMIMEIFPSSQMGTKNEIIDQMLAGMNVITLADGAFFADRGVPDLGITMAPYLFTTWDEAWNLLRSDWWASQMKLLEGKGLKVLAANFIYGDRHTLTKRPIRTVDDFRGLKLRVPANTIQVKGTEVMGANPTPLPLGEVYTALQQGVIDGVENPLSVLYGGKFHEVAKYLTLDGHIKLLTSWFCGTIFFNSLTPQQQKWLVDSGVEASEWNNTQYEKITNETVAKYKAEGVEVINVDIPAFQAKARSFYDMPEIKSMWTPGLYDIVSGAKSGK